MKDPNCIFCKIINKEIPSNIVYEDDNVLAFLDISPKTYGHTLVLPKSHQSCFLESEKETMHKVMDVAQKIGKLLMEKLGAKGVNILANNYPIAGQSVMHFHVHVIPRYNENENIYLEKEPTEKINFKEILEKLK